MRNRGASLLVLAVLAWLLALPVQAQEGKAMLRLLCDEEAAGAVVTINGEFKGECPVDISVAPGSLKLRVVRSLDADRERVFETELRVAAGTAVRREVLLGPPRLSAEAQRRADQLARELAELDRMLAAEARARDAFLAATDARHGLYCYASLHSSTGRADLFTPVWESDSRDRGDALQRASFQSFIASQHASDTAWGGWADFAAQASGGVGHNGGFAYDSRFVKKAFFGSDELQQAYQRCYETLEQAHSSRKFYWTHRARELAWRPAAAQPAPLVASAAPSGRQYCVASLYKLDPPSELLGPVWELEGMKAGEPELMALLKDFVAAQRKAAPASWGEGPGAFSSTTCGLLAQGGRCGLTTTWIKAGEVQNDFGEIECHDQALPVFRSRKSYLDGARLQKFKLRESAWMPSGAKPGRLILPN